MKELTGEQVLLRIMLGRIGQTGRQTDLSGHRRIAAP